MKALLLALAALMALGGCFGSSPQPVYYSLDTPTEPAVHERRPLTVVVRRFEARAPYDRTELVYRTHELELRFYPYHLWVAAPGRMLSETVASHLRRAGVVGLASRDVAADYELLGQVIALEENDVAEDDWRAHLAMSFQLVEARTGRVVWEHAFDEQKRIAKQKPRAVVAAMNAILDGQLEGLTTALDGYLTSVEAKRGQPVGAAGDGAAPAAR